LTEPVPAERALPVVELLLSVRTPQDVRISPDGSHVAFAMAGQADAGPVHVYVVDLSKAGSAPRAVTTATEVSHSLPRWSPDGHTLFVACGAGWEPSVLAAIDVETGRLRWDVTVDGCIEDIVVAGEHVVARVADPGSERDGMHLGLRVCDTADPRVTTPGCRLRRLVATTVDGGPLRPIDLRGHTVWEHDVDAKGRVLAVASRTARPAGFYTASLIVTDLSGGSWRDLWDGDGRQLSRPRLDPDCSQTAHVLRGLSIVSGRIHRVSLIDGRQRALDGVDDVTDLGYFDGGRLWFAGWAPDGVQFGVIDPAGLVQLRRVSPGALGGRDGQPSLCFDTRGRRAAAVYESGSQAPEIVTVSLDSVLWEPRTRLNTRALAAASHVCRKRCVWTASDGQEVDGLLLTPEGGQRLPLVVMIHGGPTWLWPDSFAPAESAGLALPLAAAGAAVLLPNPRGSSGRGQSYAEAIIGQMGAIDLDDILAGVEHVARDGVVDPERIAVMGLSYGGYLTAWALTQTRVFRAGVAMSAVADWLSFGQTSNLGGGYDLLYHPGADRDTHEGRERLIARSPAHRVQRGAAPLLIVHGLEDHVTPVGQAEQLYNAWTAAGNLAELVVYPREGHELVEPEHRRDVARRVVSWLTSHGVLTAGADQGEES